MPRATCAECLMFMRCKKNDVKVIEGMPTKNADGEEVWVPYKVWAADLWACPTCNHQIITGYSKRAIEKHDPRFEAELRFAKEHMHFIINDC